MPTIEKTTVKTFGGKSVEVSVIETSPYNTWDVYVGEEVKGEITSYYGDKSKHFAAMRGTSFEEAHAAPMWTSRHHGCIRDVDGYSSRENAIRSIIS